MKSFLLKISIIIKILLINYISTFGQGATGANISNNFNSGPGNWVVGGTSGSIPTMYDIFEHGNVTSSVYQYFKNDTTDKYFKTDMGGVYAQETHTWIKSPCYDFSTFIVPHLSLDIYANALAGFHGARLLYSLNNSTWYTLGGIGTGTNWYDNTNLSGNPCWAISGGGWVTAEHDLTFLAGEQHVYIKIDFSAGYIPTVLDGFAFDNFHITETASIYTPDITEWIFPTTNPCRLSTNENISIRLNNYGTQPLVNYYLRYSINNVFSCWEYVTQAVQPGEEIIYTFTNCHNFSSNGAFICTAEFSQDGINPIESINYDLNAEGLYSINSFPFTENFSNNTSFFGFENGLYAHTDITGGELVFSGTGVGQYWAGGSFTTSPTVAWNTNTEYQSSMHNCYVDATNVSTLELLFDMYQEFSFGPTYSWFRLLVNDMPVADINGDIDHVLGTYEIPGYHMVKYNLDQWVGTMFQLKFETVNKLSNDIVKIDNIEIREKYPYDLEIGSVVSPTSGCGLGNETVMFSFKNIGTAIASGFTMQYSVNGGSPVSQAFTGSIGPGVTQIFNFSTPIDFSSGGNINVGIIWPQDIDQNNNSLTGYSVQNTFNDVYTPYVQTFVAPNVIYSDNWVIEDTNNDGQEWGWFNDAGGNEIYAFDYEGAPGNDWLFSCCFNLNQTEFYNFHFKYATWIHTPAYLKTLTVYLSTSQSSTGIIGSPIAIFPNINTNDLYQNFDLLLTVPTSGIYYFAFKVSGNATPEAEYIFIDDVSLSRNISPDLAISDLDIGSDACSMGNVNVNIDITNLSGGVIGQGNTLEVTYSCNGNNPVVESVVTTQTFMPGDVINYTFTQPVNMSVPGIYTVIADVNYIFESNPANDTFTNTVTNFGYPQNLEVAGLDSGLCLYGPDITIYGSFTVQSWEYPVVESWISGAPSFIDNGNGSATFSLSTLGSFPLNYSVTNAGGCTSPLVENIPVTDPIIDLGPDICTYDYNTITLDAGTNPNYSYLWSTGNTNQIFIPPFYGIYSVSVTEEACTVHDSIKVYIDQEIVFNQGWGNWSTYCNVNTFSTKNISIVTQPLTDLVITKDEEGRFWWPAIPINTIGDMINGRAYQYKMNITNTLYLCGDLLIPELTAIPLHNGYNLIGYLRLNPSPVDYEMTQTPLTGLIYVKDETGAIYWQAFGINTIGNFLPGKGYQVKMESTVVQDFYYTPN